MATSPPVLYYLAPSPPCRAVLLMARALDLQLVLREVNVLKGEHLDAAFIKINPQHTIPTLDDNGFILWESRSIMCYLVDQHGKDDSLYPRDPKKRALVDQRLFFDSGTLYARIAQYFGTVMFSGKLPDPGVLQKIEEAVGFLDKFLEGRAWVTGDTCTVADYALVVSVSAAEGFNAKINKYHHVRRWYSRCKSEMSSYQELNQTPGDMLAGMFHQRVAELSKAE